jgi:hypothetical protein
MSFSIVDEHDRGSIRWDHTPNRSQNLIQNLSIIQGGAECFGRMAQCICQGALLVLDLLDLFTFGDVL